eukprot:1332978-Pleurochrysis_carterae.AAC.2
MATSDGLQRKGRVVGRRAHRSRQLRSTWREDRCPRRFPSDVESEHALSNRSGGYDVGPEEEERRERRLAQVEGARRCLRQLAKD